MFQNSFCRIGSFFEYLILANQIDLIMCNTRISINKNNIIEIFPMQFREYAVVTLMIT